MKWSQISADFAYDGSLRDIYILDTSFADWEKVWELLLSGPGCLEFGIHGAIASPPKDVGVAFAQREAVFASYRLGKITFNCHFFSTEEIEFDFNPREVDDQASAQELESFMVSLGRVTSREVLLTAENQTDAVIARYLPGIGEVLWNIAQS